MFKVPFYILGILLIIVSGTPTYSQTAAQLNRFIEGDSLSVFQFQKSLSVLNPLIEELDDANKEEAILKIKALELKGHNLEQLNHLKEALPILLNVIEQSNGIDLLETKYQAYITIALIHEKNGDLKKCEHYLEKARTLHSQNDLKSLYALYCVRKSSFYRVSERDDSAQVYADKALKYAIRYKDRKQEIDGHLLLGHLTQSTEEQIVHYSAAAHLFFESKNFLNSASMYDNITTIYLRLGNFEKGLTYSDSAYLISHKSDRSINSGTHENRALIFEALGEKDSALVYYKQFIQSQLKEWQEIKNAEITKTQRVYDHNKQEEKIKYQESINAKQQQFIYLWAVLFLMVALVFVLLFVMYRKLKVKNGKIISQSEKLKVSIAEKEVLLAEVQHRVKNNLQLIIGLLEIQKEKVDYTPIDELITENQNRIMSMAFLHNKLNFSSGNEYVNFETYLHEVTSLLQNSFAGLNKDIEFNLNSETNDICIDEAISLGLIIVELINNSMKHAFKKQTKGVIKIELFETDMGEKTRVLIYQDNGTGFDKAKMGNQGTGLEIINGLIKQINGNIELFDQNGFKAKIVF